MSSLVFLHMPLFLFELLNGDRRKASRMDTTCTCTYDMHMFTHAWRVFVSTLAGDWEGNVIKFTGCLRQPEGQAGQSQEAKRATCRSLKKNEYWSLKHNPIASSLQIPNRIIITSHMKLSTYWAITEWFFYACSWLRGLLAPKRQGQTECEISFSFWIFILSVPSTMTHQGPDQTVGVLPHPQNQDDECKPCLVNQAAFAPPSWWNRWNKLIQLYSAFKRAIFMTLQTHQKQGNFTTLQWSERIWRSLTTFLSSIVHNATGTWIQVIFLAWQESLRDHGALSSWPVQFFPIRSAGRHAKETVLYLE